MTVEEARGYVTDYYLAETHSDEDKFSFVEALHVLIEEIYTIHLFYLH